MPTIRRSFLTWGSCTRPIILQRAPGRLSMTILRLLDWVSELCKPCSIVKCALLIVLKLYRKSQVRDRRGTEWLQAWRYTQAEPHSDNDVRSNGSGEVRERKKRKSARLLVGQLGCPMTRNSDEREKLKQIVRNMCYDGYGKS